MCMLSARLLNKHIHKSKSALSIPATESESLLRPLEELAAEQVIMVSNRLPVSAVQRHDGEWELVVSRPSTVIIC